MDRSRYRFVNFIGGRILQAREMDKLQDITRGVDDNNVATAFDLDAVYEDGATFNVKAVITPNTKTVTLLPIDGTKPMLVFVRGRFEILKPAEAPAITLTVAQTKLYLNWQLKKITYGAVDGDTTDSLLKDMTTNEAAAEMGEMRLSISATDDSARALAATEFEKNTAPVVVFSFVHTANSVTQDAKDNVDPQALASNQSAGLVKTTTANPVVASTDDPRLTDGRTPTDLSVTNAKVRVPVQDGVATNADGTKRYDLTKDPGGIDSAKVVHQAGTQLVSEIIEKNKSDIATTAAALDAHDTAPLGQGNTHPMPTAAQVGATPAAHQALSLDQAHGLAASKNAGGFSITRDKAVAPAAGDGAFTVKDQDGDLAKLTHEGDVFAKLANGQVAAALLEGADTNASVGNGPLGNLSAIAKALAAHVNKKSHNNPHGLALADLGGASTPYVDSADQSVLDAAIAYSDLIGSITVRKEVTLNPVDEVVWDLPGGGPGDWFRNVAKVTRFFGWVILNIGNRVELAFGQGSLRNGENVPMPNGFSVLNCVASAGMSSYLDKNDLNSPTWAAGVGSMKQTADGAGSYRPNGTFAEHASSWGEKAGYGHVTAVAWRLLTPPAVIIKLDKISGAVGTVVTMSGRNFGADKTKVVLTVGGVNAAITSCAPTSIVFTVPAGLAAGAKTVTLKINGVDAINQTSFTVS